MEKEQNEIKQEEMQGQEKPNETIELVKQEFKKQLEEEKRKHAEEIAKLNKKIEEEHARHIQDIKDILSTGHVSIPQDEQHAPTEEEEILNKMRAIYNLK